MSNRGTGGAHEYRVLNAKSGTDRQRKAARMRQPLAALDHYAAALPKRDPGRGAWYQPERDTVVDDWVAWAELEQNGRRLLALGTAYVRHGEVFVLNVKDGSDTRNRLPTRDPGTLILNEHPLDCAIQHLFTEHAT